MNISLPQSSQSGAACNPTGPGFEFNWVSHAIAANPSEVTADHFRWGEFTRSPRRPPPQTGLMTAKKLKALIQAGHGQGHEQHYKSWLRVTRGDYSPCSRVGHLDYPDMFRLMHPRSMGESDESSAGNPTTLSKRRPSVAGSTERGKRYRDLRP